MNRPEGDAQVGVGDELGREAGEAGDLADHGVPGGRFERVPLEQGQGVVPEGEGARFVQDRGQVLGQEVRRELLVVPGIGGVGGKEEHVGHVVHRREPGRLEVEDGRDEDDAVEVHARASAPWR